MNPNDSTLESEPPEAELHIRSAEDLFGAIRHGEYFERLHLLEALAADPGVGLEYGSFDGQDLVDVLRGELESASDPNLRVMLLAVLAGIPGDARVNEALLQIWCLSPHPDEQLVALERLVREPSLEIQTHLEVMLRQDEDPDRARMIANHWVARSDLAPADQVRVAVACEFECPTPPTLEANTASAWRSALHSPFRARAQEWLEDQGEAAFHQILRWSQRADDTRWLLEWGAPAGFPGVEALARRALESDDTALQETGLRALARVGTREAETAPLLERFAHAEPHVRLEAVRAGLRLEFSALAVDEPDAALRLEAIARLNATDLNVLTRLLEDADWRVRARATERLIALGREVTEPMRELLDDPRLEVRTAAARVLMELGDDAWLEERLL
jgi:hypothetical protein